MKGQTFRQRLLNSTRGRVLSRLRGGARTVNDLAVAMGLTDNAVRAHLTSLERDGLIHQTGMQPGVRKPHMTFGLTTDAEQIFPKAYGTLLTHLVDAVSKRLSPRAMNASLREVGRTVAGHLLNDLPLKSRAVRLDAAIDVLASIGGAASLDEEGGRTFIRGDNCPLSAITAHHPRGCVIAESLLTELIGVPVKERCIHGDRPRCCFEVPADGVGSTKQS